MTPLAHGGRGFVEAHTRRLRPLLHRATLASWEAATTGREEAVRISADARAAVKRLYADPEGARKVRDLLAADVADSLLRRQLVLLDHEFSANQLPTATIRELSFREAELERTFYNFRARLDGREASDNELREVLRTAVDERRRREAWRASKEIGPRIAGPLVELVRRRNAAARQLGFADYYAMELRLQEIDEDELFRLLADFRERSEAAFRQMRAGMDARLAGRFGVAVDDLRPWHWEDFYGQEAPALGVVNLDSLFQQTDLEGVVHGYFGAIGLPVDDVMARSDLYEREGKAQHAFATDMDREGDVRILCNLRSNEKWMRTLLHELGHAVYDALLPRSLPFLLRIPAHTLATEAIAMFFGRLTRDPEWLAAVSGHSMEGPLAADVRDQQRLSMLVAARWMLVMVHFERELYRDPDRGDFDRIWWDLVEELQLVRRPEVRNGSEWATKIHLSLAPVYYHNYLLGELMASQLSETMSREGIAVGSTDPRIGHFLRERIFDRGATLPWSELLRDATGEPLTARSFVDQFVEARIEERA
jgi:peptidyl-dipeptidase A